MKHKNTKDFFSHTMVTFFLRTVVRTTVQMFVLVRSLVPVYRYDVPVLQSLELFLNAYPAPFAAVIAGAVTEEAEGEKGTLSKITKLEK